MASTVAKQHPLSLFERLEKVRMGERDMAGYKYEYKYKYKYKYRYEYNVDKYT